MSSSAATLDQPAADRRTLQAGSVRETRGDIARLLQLIHGSIRRIANDTGRVGLKLCRSAQESGTEGEALKQTRRTLGAMS